MDEIVKTMAQYLCAMDGHDPDEWLNYQYRARAAIAAIMPAIGERMAKVAERYSNENYGDQVILCAGYIREDIRALASTMAEEVGK